MGRIGKILSFNRVERLGVKLSDVQVSIGGGEIITAEHFSSPGDDSFPKVNDWVQVVKQAGTGRWSVVGYIDPKNDQKANDGDKISYARDTSGYTVIWSWLKNDGSGIIDNGSGVIELKTNGDINLNGVIIKPNGDIIAPTKITTPSIIVNGKELDDHDHDILGGSSAPGPTGGNN